MKRFIINVIAFLAILILPAPIWLVLTHKESYPIDPERNIVFIGDSRTAYGLDDKVFPRAKNHSHSYENPFGAYITLRSILAGENNIDTVVLSFWGSSLGGNIKCLTDAERGFDKRMQYVTIKDIAEANLNPIDLIEPTITTLLYPNDPHGGYNARRKYFLQDDIEKKEAEIESNGGRLTRYNIHKGGIYYKGFCKIQELCNERGIKLILMTLPAYNSDRYYGQADFKEKLRDSLRGCGLTYVDFSDFPLADSCYADILHLNAVGAKIFSKHLSENGLFAGADEVLEL